MKKRERGGHGGAVEKLVWLTVESPIVGPASRYFKLARSFELEDNVFLEMHGENARVHKLVSNMTTTTVMSIAEKVLERIYGSSKSTLSVADGEKTQRHTHHHVHKHSYDDSDDDVCYSDEDESAMELVQLGAERTKNVLILMSDTGGGHRASAEAIRDAFKIQYGDKYRIIVKDVWKEYTGWPLNDMESSYKFMVKHVQLWKVAFHTTSPKWVHSCYLAAIAAYYAKEVEAGLMEYKPEIIISVHPLMQHIPCGFSNGKSYKESPLCYCHY
ncbi:hypothetical protein Bca52824_051231 [Brassica carinata]|uniref:Diacylglycerol glucosyltransferase N-terminal domain-containing protein n=1 Tax=Brassica carinata TaxID=52824 RepID=A0A8X7UL67_BRACI|nr:hypothetical protein Bca52824_051231 [Brassica carinata]